MPDLNQIINKLAKSTLDLMSRPAKYEGELIIDQLKEPVQIKRDRWGVPHIFAANQSDLFTAQGFVHAQERLFQMEFNRRLVAGRLSEVFGSLTLPVDRWMRTLTMRKVAEYEVGMLSPDGIEMIEAYALGVNAFIHAGSFPIEFTLLRYKPEPWVPADSLSWIKMMAWTLSVNWETEILRARLIERVGIDKTRELDPDYAADQPTIIPENVDFSAIGADALKQAQMVRPFSGPSPYSGIGSNNWAVHGSRTASGMPLFANDMHLKMTLPAIWFENHLSCPAFECTGVSFVGIPGVISGHNGQVAWGYTNGFPDVQDLFMERIRRANDGTVEVEYQGNWEPAQVYHEEIQVKDQEAVSHEVVITRHGPIINQLAAEISGETPLALCWTALEPNTMIEVLFNAVKANNAHEFHAAFAGWHTPSQNIVYADKQGNIGYTLGGRIPIRAKGDGQLPVPGWTDEYEWIGYIPFEHLPHIINPSQGFIASANNRVVGDEYPYYLGRETISGDRAERITELLQANQNVDVAAIKKMHFDVTNPSAIRLAALLGSLETQNTELAPVVQMMRDWNGSLSADSPAAAVYEIFYRRMINMLVSDQLDEVVFKESGNGSKELLIQRTDLAERYLGKGPTPLLMDNSLFGFRSLEWLLGLLGKETSVWYDQGANQTRDEVMLLALADTVSTLKTIMGPNPDDWAWGKLHQLHLIHPMGSVDALSAFLNRGPYPLPGDQNTVWATGAELSIPDGENVVAPPYRMIVDLGDLANSCSILAPGQSGRPGTQHYDDQIQDWYDGQYHPMLFTPEQLAQEDLKVLTLKPRIST